MQQEVTNICEQIGIAPIVLLNLPKEDGLETLFQMLNNGRTFDDEAEEINCYNSFKQGYLLSLIQNHLSK